jgi:hypothetical protein
MTHKVLNAESTLPPVPLSELPSMKALLQRTSRARPRGAAANASTKLIQSSRGLLCQARSQMKASRKRTRTMNLTTTAPHRL